MKGRHLATLSVAAVVTAFFAGGVTAHNQLDEKYKTATEHVKIIHTETETTKEVQVPTVPESCLRASELSKVILKAFEDYDEEAGKLKMIAEPLGAAIAGNNLKQLNKAKESIMVYNSSVAKVVGDYASAKEQLDAAVEHCASDTSSTSK